MNDTPSDDDYKEMKLVPAGGQCENCLTVVEYPHAMLFDHSGWYDNGWMLICLDCLRKSVEIVEAAISSAAPESTTSTITGDKGGYSGVLILSNGVKE